LTFPPATCPNCGQTIHIIEPLTFSIVAARLLYRGDAELRYGDFTMPIICGAMAIDSALTSLFLKWKRLENELLANPTTDADREA
jgi:rRNA maturation protein Nop10